MTCRWRNFASSLNEFLTKQRSRVPSTFLEAMSSRREKGREERKKKERQDDFKLKNCYPVWYGWLLFVVNVCVCVCVCTFMFLCSSAFLTAKLAGWLFITEEPPSAKWAEKDGLLFQRCAERTREGPKTNDFFKCSFGCKSVSRCVYDSRWLTPSKGWWILILFGIAMCHYLPKKVTMWKILENIPKRFIPCY